MTRNRDSDCTSTKGYREETRTTVRVFWSFRERHLCWFTVEVDGMDGRAK